jgi:hypothetical protein
LQGGFDFRVRLFSAKTLKQLLVLKYHKGIVNQVNIEAVGDDKINVYSVAEDGDLACWTNL